VTGAEREHTSVARSIGQILAPSSIAVVGASRRAGSIGRGILSNLVAGRFAGALYAVNPHTPEVDGVQSYASVLDIPGPVDVAVIAVPARGVLDIMRQCAEKGVHGVVVISGGFAELAGGETLQDQLVAVARQNRMRVVGPNCVGVINTSPAVAMNATFSPVAPEAGRLGFASQSGGIGIELLARAKAYGLGVSTFVSLGNKADVSGNDLLQYWAEDPDTDVILLYLESFGNPGKFARLAREISRRKPVIAMKSGRTMAGARGARSHTAALTDVDVAVDELLHHAGVIRVDTLEEMFDTAALIAHQPLPDGPRVAIMSNGGGPGILAADACIAAGLEVLELSEPVQRRLGAIAPPGAGVQNPVDLIASADADVFRAAADILLRCDEVDALLVIYVSPLVTQPGDVAAALIETAQAELGKPIAACFLGLDHPVGMLGDSDGGDGERRTGRTVPTFAFPESAAYALGRAARLGAWRRRPEGIVPVLERIDADRARELVAATLGTRPDGAWAPHAVATEILTAFGIPVVLTRRADTVEAAVAAAESIGYPVALKAASPALVHKTDVGGVHLGLRTGDDVRNAFATMQRVLGASMGGANVQPMADPGVELIVGVTRDPQFGPLVVFGMGGMAAELQRDTSLRLPPLTDIDVQEMLRSLRGSPLLFGYRGSPPVDTDALADVLTRVSRLAESLPELAELDCNPVIASSSGALVVDVKLRLAPPS
jgi:acetate---CoA ligase (ADP-forming)